VNMQSPFCENERERLAVESFLEFLRIKTISAEGPKGAYRDAVCFLRPQLEDLGFETWEKEYVQGKPLLIAKMQGTLPGEKAILLTSHYDVVPVVEKEWNSDAFDPKVTENGDIFARGTQDMKSVCIQYIEALRLMKEENQLPTKRTLILTFVPDEEIGSADGMGTMVEDKELMAQLNIGMALDEGLANPEDSFTVFYGERAIWWCRIKATGGTGHGSRFIKNTAMQKLIDSISHFLAFRKQQEHALEAHSGCQHAVSKKLKLGDVTTVNLTMLKGGVSNDGGKTYSLNVIPTEAEAGFDIRIAPDVSLEEFECKIKEWTSQEGLSYEFVVKTKCHAISSIDEAESFYWSIFKKACDDNSMNIETEIFPAATDSRFLRQKGIPAFGFSPMNNTPILLHDHNEKINVQTFLKGIKIYQSLIGAIANAIEDKSPKARL